MRVVIDSSILIRDFHLTSSASRVFMGEVKRTGHAVFVPEVVFDEVTNKFEEQIRKGVGRLEGGIRDVERLGGVELRKPIREEGVLSICDGYRSELREKLRSIATFLDYPKTAHRDLVRRELDRRQPFQETGTGYRDALIWENVLDLAREDDSEPVALISANYKDFAVSKDAPDYLHQDLLDDLSPDNGIASKVELVPSLDQFNDKHIIPELEKYEEMAKLLAAREHPRLDLLDFIQNDLAKHVASQEFEAGDLGFFLGIQHANFADVKRLDEVRIIDVRRLTKGQFLVELTLEGEITYDVYIPQELLYDLRGGEPIFVWEEDWNEWFALATTQLTTQLGLRMIYDDSDGEILSAEISSIEPLEEWWTKFPEPYRRADTGELLTYSKRLTGTERSDE